MQKNEALRFLQQILHTGPKDISCNDVDQIHARGAEFFLLNRFNMAHSECSQIRYYQPKNQQF